MDTMDARGEAWNTGRHAWKEGKRGNRQVFVRFDTPAEVRRVGPSLSPRMRAPKRSSEIKLQTGV